MELSLREAWSQVILAADYELHMANVGQAQANAGLMRDLVLAAKLAPQSRVLIAGAGPGQFFQFASADYLESHEVVLTDINHSFVELALARAAGAGLERVKAQVDDIEATQLVGPFALAVLVLVLEHVDWRRAIGQVVGLGVGRLLIVIQRNPESLETMVTPHRELPGSLKACQSGEKPHLLEEKELVAQLLTLGFTPTMREERPVPDGKSMIGLMFTAS